MYSGMCSPVPIGLLFSALACDMMLAISGMWPATDDMNGIGGMDAAADTVPVAPISGDPPLTEKVTGPCRSQHISQKWILR